MKYIICNTPKGQYKLPAHLVAEDRATYYACDIDGHEQGGKEWEEEVEYALDDSYECIDWLLNNTNWEEWTDQAVKLNDTVFVTDAAFWTNSDDFEMIDGSKDE
jgi:hypothetical protein